KHSSVEDAAREAALRSIEVRKDASIVRAKADVEQADKNNYRVLMRPFIEYSDLTAEEELETTVRIKGAICPRCSKIVGNYYESIIQVRGRGRKLSERQKERYLEEIDRRVEAAKEENREMFVSKVEEVPGGLDFYLSSISLGKAISKELADRAGAEVKESSTLVTQKEGRDVYRVTYLVRLPSYMRGEVIMHKDVPHIVAQIAASTTKLINLKTHEPVNVSNADLYEAKVLGRREDILDAVVLTDSKREVQVMNPRTYATVEVRKPSGYAVKGETVRVFVHEDELFLIP
ncbi:MAG TPA: NMD3-related protein, partial [Methanomassiliicoccales archaeon]|nr:NMD3-related protein [Methanomassiliicoccales archaeon]